MNKKEIIRSAEGFILEPVLIVFLMTVMFCSYCALCAQSKSGLILASRRSELDRQITEQARAFAAERSWQKRCNISGYVDSPIRNISIGEVPVVLTDRTTYIEAAYSYEESAAQILLYYDATGVISTEIVQKNR